MSTRDPRLTPARGDTLILDGVRWFVVADRGYVDAVVPPSDVPRTWTRPQWQREMARAEVVR